MQAMVLERPGKPLRLIKRPNPEPRGLPLSAVHSTASTYSRAKCSPQASIRSGSVGQ
jgi:hypothetical protein